MTAPDAALPRRVAVVGAGEIGSGWAALFAAHGVRVRLYDPDPDSVERARRALAIARAIGAGSAVSEREVGDIEHERSLDAALEGSGWVQESLPERISLKREVLRHVLARAESSAVVASSTSTFTVRELSDEAALRRRLVVAHPLHPVYAVPAVELSAPPDGDQTTVERARVVLSALGREPVFVRGELPGLVANRLTAALLREAFDLVARGAVDAGELDRLVARGIALGWAAAGPLRTEAIGAGAGGLRTFLDRMGEPLGRLWGSLASWDALTPARREALREAAARLRGEEPGAWARTLARTARAAAGRDGAD